MHSNDAIEVLADAPVDPFNSQEVVVAFSIAIKETRILDKSAARTTNYSGIFTSSLAFLYIKFLAR